MKVGIKAAITDDRGLDIKSKEHLEHCKAQAQDNSLIPLGIWGDGAPCNWNREESVETFSLNLPGQKGEFRKLRLPITALCRRHVSENTWDDILKVVSWSLRHCANGTYPQRRHNNTPWLKSDKQRRKNAQQRFDFKAALVEVRGDWKFFGECFKFPKHNTKEGCCWSCRCTPEQVDGFAFLNEIFSKNVLIRMRFSYKIPPD